MRTTKDSMLTDECRSRLFTANDSIHADVEILWTFYWFLCSSPFVRRFEFCQKKEGKNVIEFPLLKSHEDLMPFPGNIAEKTQNRHAYLFPAERSFSSFFISSFHLIRQCTRCTMSLMDVERDSPRSVVIVTDSIERESNWRITFAQLIRI